MCGFVGYMHDNPQKIGDVVEINKMKEMSTIITHRGPDDEGYFADQYINFGFRRLSIIDIESGSQPLSYENEQYWIIFIGEIYNHIELRNELVQKDYEFKTKSDTEVIVALSSGTP